MKRTPYTMLITLLRWSLLATLLLGFAAQAEPVARVLMANGDVRAIQSDQSVRALNRGDMLYAGDTIRTGKTSSTQFRFTDGALIALRAESEFNIEQHHYNEQTPQQNEQSGQLVRGGLRAITGAIGRERPEAVNMRTPVATIGIRGTVYETIYIPPGSHPALPGVESGHYTVVLRGRVAISNAAGELIIGDGEIAFVRDANTPPVLRPDLSALFARFAALDNVEEIIAELQEDEGKLQDVINVVTETALQSQGTVSPGPLGFVLSKDGDGIIQVGNFFSTPMVLEGIDGNELISAQDGTGDLTEFTQPVDMSLSYSDSAIAGDSTMRWGYFSDDISSSIDYITASNVFVNTSDLPTTGTHNYYYAGGTGYVFEDNSNLSVNFGNATMSVLLNISGGEMNWSASNQNITDFYGSGINLTGFGGVGDGQIFGRFSGTGAEGAISYYILDDGVFNNVTGTAAFSRTMPSPEPFGFLGILSSKVDGPTDALWGGFFEQPVSMSGEYLIGAEGGTGSLNSFTLLGEPAISTTGTGLHSTGDSIIYWGGYYSSEEVVSFEYTPTGDPAWWEEASYITATRVIDKLTDVSLLSSLGTVTYESVGGASWLGVGSTLTVNFGDATMDANIVVNHELTLNYEAFGQSIADFYGTGIALEESLGSGSGSLAGRFVGTNAEGAIAIFDGFYDWGSGSIDNFLGTVAFDRLASEIIPQ